MPKRLNRAIELLEAGQPVFPTSAGQLTYENGKQMAGTYADILLVDFEHGAFDVRRPPPVHSRPGRRRPYPERAQDSLRNFHVAFELPDKR